MGNRASPISERGAERILALLLARASPLGGWVSTFSGVAICAFSILLSYEDVALH